MELKTDTLKKSGLRIKGELDDLLGVSFVMVHKYLNGAVPRTESRRRLISTTLETLNALIEKGTLPFSEDKDADYRKRAVAKIKEHVQSKLH